MLSDDDIKALLAQKRNPGRKPLPQEKQDAILADVLKYGNLQYAAERSGVSRSVVYRLIEKLRKAQGAK